MTKRPRTLTAAFVRTVGRPGVYGDGRGGRGLSLRVHRTASGRITKTWRLRLAMAHTRTWTAPADRGGGSKGARSAPLARSQW